jgi:hypothetical protein
MFHPRFTVRRYFADRERASDTASNTVIPAGQGVLILLAASDVHRCTPWRDWHSVQTDKNARQYRSCGFLLSGVNTFSLALTGTSRACSACPIRPRLQCVSYSALKKGDIALLCANKTLWPSLSSLDKALCPPLSIPAPQYSWRTAATSPRFRRELTPSLSR